MQVHDSQGAEQENQLLSEGSIVVELQIEEEKKEEVVLAADD